MASYGISVYPDLRPLEEIKDYMTLAAKCGCSRVFSSMFSVEGTEAEIFDYFQALIAHAHSIGMEVSLDVNKPCLERFGASPSDLSVFHDLGCDILRLDTPLDLEGYRRILDNPYGIKLELNASIGERGEELIHPLKNEVTHPEAISLCYNFYPQRYTGMKWEKFKAIARRLRPTGFPLTAFVSCKGNDTHGVWDAKDGLPTVERHRDLPIDLQAREMIALGVERILIGNAYATEEELKALQTACAPIIPPQDDPLAPILKSMGIEGSKLGRRGATVKLKICPDPTATELERRVLFSFYPHSDVGDSSEWIWRSRMPRMVYAKESFTPRTCQQDAFSVGDVVMVNDNYKHYAAEVQIVRKPIRNDGTRNLVGHILPMEAELLNLAQDGDTIIFIEA